jgi:hypothetical protein
VRAEEPVATDVLLANPETELQGALAACTEAVRDPVAAQALLTEAGFEPGEGYEGTTELTKGNIYVMMWDEPGFCMVEDLTTNTEAMEDTFFANIYRAVESETDEAGCMVYLLGDIRATLSGPGQDPVCTSDTGAALRFELTQ